MSIVSKRLGAQVYIETALGCHEPSYFHQKKEELEALRLDENAVIDVREILREDACDLYYKGILSLFQGFSDLDKNLHSWATVKFYYAVFYFLRASLAADQLLIIRNKKMYYCANRKGAEWESCAVKGDHKTIIKIHKNIMKERDNLLTNNIAELDIYSWLMERREEIQYRANTFYEPLYWEYYQFLQNTNLFDAINIFVNDEDYVFCFDEDYACLAAPIKRCIQTLSIIKSDGLSLTKNQIKHIQMQFSDLFREQKNLFNLFLY